MVSEARKNKSEGDRRWFPSVLEQETIFKLFKKQQDEIKRLRSEMNEMNERLNNLSYPKK